MIFSMHQSHVKVHISNTEGASAWFLVDSKSTCDSMKIEAVEKLFSCSDSSKMSVYYSILHVGSGRIVSDKQTLEQAAIGNKDELLLVKRRLSPSDVPLSKEEDTRNVPPTAAEISAATSRLQVLNVERNRLELTDSDLQTDMKPILVTLIDAAQRLVCISSAKDLEEAKKYVACANVCSVPRTPYLVDEQCLQRLVEMGFDRAKAAKALVVNRMSYVQAVQWLCDHADSDVSEVDTPDQVSVTAPSLTSPAANEPETSDGLPVSMDEKVRMELHQLAQLTGAAKVQRMLDAFRCYRHRIFKPDPNALRSLLEMGFDESLVLDSLCMHDNNKNEACKWLLNQATETCLTADRRDAVPEGLDPTCSLYSAIMSDHVVRLSLTSHKTLIALLHILENPDSRQQWLRDPDLNLLLVQISRIYNFEKHRQC